MGATVCLSRMYFAIFVVRVAVRVCFQYVRKSWWVVVGSGVGGVGLALILWSLLVLMMVSSSQDLASLQDDYPFL